MQEQDVDTIVKFVSEPQDRLPIWSHDLDKLERIAEATGKKSLTDALSYVLNRYEALEGDIPEEDVPEDMKGER